ncbi:DNA translocase FtsK [Alkalihalobacterium alkalinitrilicum]|uniref:DNA translocase FtsK n=1 Tax=Alkalihalobacterium alkalinitrilicum TaxID=427920 RepID=UPI0023687004|nr:DNA translocase FtsK [Alkalihalobacterium alkalinitrilicum]
MEPTRKKSQYGRLEADDRQSDLRVVHQYPKQGKFRFPVIEDAPQIKGQKKEETERHKVERRKDEEKKRVVSTYQGAKEEYNRPNEKKRELFTNNHFKPTSIPSPVYGFKQRENKNVTPLPSIVNESLKLDAADSITALEEAKEMIKFNRNEKDHSTNVEDEIAVTTEPVGEAVASPLINEREEFHHSNVVKANDEYDDDEKMEEHLEDYSMLKDEYLGEMIIDQEDLRETSIEERQELELEAPFEQEQEQELFADLTQGTEEEPNCSQKALTNQIKEDQLEATPIEKDKEQEKIEILLERATKEEEIKEPAQEQTQKLEPETKIEQNVTSKKQPKDSVSKSSTTIPYNVIMLPQDRLEKQRKGTQEETKSYQFPPINMLNIPPRYEEEDTEWLNQQGEILESTLQNFNVSAKVIHVTKGPSVTRFEIQPAPGVKVSKITGLTDDIKLCLAAKDIRMEAPIPGKHAIGIEVPNLKSTPVYLREILRRGVFQKGSPLTVALGLDISGQPIVTDLTKMPHGLVAGATGSGKSVCINSILVSLLYKATPDQVKLLLVDPKMVELAPYNELPHLVTPVITDAKQATAALKWVVAEMERRYELFSQQGVRDLGRYNDLYSEDVNKPALPYIVVVIDELADLMMVSPQDVEEAICRIAQKARACGIHLLLATQRPSVDVITGLLKANIPTRIAFSVSSQVDSRTIIDMNGAERLLGKGDMLFHENGTAKPVRVQGTFVSDEEIERVIEFVKKQREPQYLIDNEHLTKGQDIEGQDDELFEEACYFVIEQDGASASSLQRRFRVGYNRAARLIDMMEAKGIVSEAMGSKPRHILMSVSEFEENILSTSKE